ncbi:MAG: response regulator, partial [Alphaproteobacteria bacterium]|nr:response regulator [Alphaproteobacteria bacterium]
IAHDFNNMLTVIIGNLELLQSKKQIDADAERFLSSSIGAARRGTSFTQRLLAFSRKQALRPEAVPVEPLFAELVQLMKRTLGETIEIITKVESAPAVLVDRNQLENALINLAVNARDAMAEGGKLWLTARPVVNDGRPFVQIEVIDEGNGMPPDVLSRAIEPFYTTKSTTAGTGLGLSMVYGFAGQSGGRFEIDSKEGAGTTVRLLLPATSSPKPTTVPKAISPQILPEGNEKLLVVEDDPDVREIAVAALSSLGYHVTQAGDGPTAVAVAAGLTDLDLLVTDVVLPRGMSGTDVSVEIRRLFPRVKVLFMSGYSGDALMEHGALRRGIELLSKPYSKAALATRVRSILDKV